MQPEDVVGELTRVANLLGRRTLSRREFARHGKLSASVVERTFGSWNKALSAAGLQVTTTYFSLTEEDLAAEFERVRQELDKVPTRSEFASRSKHSPTIYERRFGSWRKTVGHYVGQPPSEAGAGATASGKDAPVRKPVRVTTTGTYEPKGKRVFGAPLNFRELRHEPIDEQGVVFLFGMVARELGFLVESVRTPFPDCRAKRRVKGGNYVEVDIELEFKSSNFREHGHPSEGCDLVVCWVHDWPDCPVEVLELKSAIQQLDPNVR